jgi:hypothetical protein
MKRGKNPFHDKVYSIQHYVIKFVINLCINSNTSSNTTYKPTSFDKDEILANHRSFMISLNIPSAKESEDLPYLYWIPKLHKTPYKERYIAGSSTCSTKLWLKALWIVSFKRVFNLSCGRVVYRVEKSKVLMEDTWEKDLDFRLS